MLRLKREGISFDNAETLPDRGAFSVPGVLAARGNTNGLRRLEVDNDTDIGYVAANNTAKTVANVLEQKKLIDELAPRKRQRLEQNNTSGPTFCEREESLKRKCNPSR